MRRTCVLVLVLALVFPMVAGAGGPDEDPNGTPEPGAVTVSTVGDLQASALSAWLDSVLRVLLAQLGV